VWATGPDPAGRRAKQREAWDYVRRSLDRGVPCYGWELDVPEFYTIHGYDETGYHYTGPPLYESAGPKPWQEPGVNENGGPEMYAVELCEPAPDATVVRDALSAALEHARTPEQWTVGPRSFGPRAYDTWADALDSGTADRFGLGYNGAVWAECRTQAVAFLEEAKQRLPGRADAAFDEAIGHFEVVRDRLAELSRLYPFKPDSGEAELVTSPAGAVLAREAGSGERAGLAVFERLVAVI
jgi:hypothetical protein